MTTRPVAERPGRQLLTEHIGAREAGDDAAIRSSIHNMAKAVRADQFALARAALSRAAARLPPDADDAAIMAALADAWTGLPPEARSAALLGELPDQAPELYIHDDWAEPGKQPEWLIENWLPAGRICLFAGEGGRGKSRLALMLAAGMASVARDRDWLPGGPELSRHGTVVFATWEETRDSIRRRLCDWPPARTGDFRETLPALLENRLAVIDCVRAGSAWGPREDGSRRGPTLGELTPTGRALRAEAERREASLLIIDPLAAAFALNENDRGAVRGFMSDWDAWARSTQCTVLLISHPPKSRDAYSGSTDWYGASRAVWTMGLKELPDKSGQAVRLECIKVNEGRKPEPLLLEDWHWWTASPWSGPSPAAARRPDGNGAARHGGPSDLAPSGRSSYV
ncbi:MAG: AAA family ATPase [Alphaproteobacteria bacterium]|nr:AAA family ATPase [Alphaproteobacteria bacterium]